MAGKKTRGRKRKWEAPIYEKRRQLREYCQAMGEDRYDAHLTRICELCTACERMAFGAGVEVGVCLAREPGLSKITHPLMRVGENFGIYQLSILWNRSMYRPAGTFQLKSWRISCSWRAWKPARSLLYRFSARFTAARKSSAL